MWHDNRPPPWAVVVSYKAVGASPRRASPVSLANHAAFRSQQLSNPARYAWRRTGPTSPGLGSTMGKRIPARMWLLTQYAASADVAMLLTTSINNTGLPWRHLANLPNPPIPVSHTPLRFPDRVNHRLTFPPNPLLLISLPGTRHAPCTAQSRTSNHHRAVAMLSGSAIRPIQLKMLNGTELIPPAYARPLAVARTSHSDLRFYLDVRDSDEDNHFHRGRSPGLPRRQESRLLFHSSRKYPCSLEQFH